MSNHLISATYKRDLRTPMRKSVMALLADKASDDGAGIYASKKTMADELCCSKQAIIDTIKAFVAEGLLVILGARAAPNGHTVEYGINVEALEALALVKCHADREARKATQTVQRAGPVKEDDQSATLTPPVKEVDPNPPEPLPPVATQQSESAREVSPKDLIPEVVEAWQGTAERFGLPMLRGSLSADRRKKLMARLREHPIDDWQDAFRAFERSKFLRGETGNWRGATFDFLLSPKTFQRTIEGTYDDPRN